MVHNGRTLTSLKYFCENAPEYHIVCAGSLLGIALRKQLSFPVGKVDFMTLYPMSYVEFLRACGSRQLRRKIPHFFDRVRSEIQRTREEYQFCKNLSKRKKHRWMIFPAQSKTRANTSSIDFFCSAWISSVLSLDIWEPFFCVSVFVLNTLQEISSFFHTERTIVYTKIMHYPEK